MLKVFFDTEVQTRIDSPYAIRLLLFTSKMLPGSTCNNNLLVEINHIFLSGHSLPGIAGYIPMTATLPANNCGLLKPKKN